MTNAIRKSDRFLQCGCGDEYGERSVDVGRVTFGVCETCKKFWHVCENLTSRWKDELSELGQIKAEMLWSQRYLELKANFNQVDSSEVERYSTRVDYFEHGCIDLGYHPESYAVQLEKTPLHPAIKLFPEMNDEQFQWLKQSIKRYGLRQRIVLWEGQIVDGRARLKACIETSVSPAFMELHELQDPYEYAIDANLNRRHFSEVEAAAVVENIADAQKQIEAFRVVTSVERYPDPSIPF